MEQNRVEFNQTIEELKVQHQRQIDENKVEAENRLSMAQSNLEMQLSIQKVRNEATEKERAANLAQMSSEFKTFMNDMIRQHVELESISSQRWQESTNQNSLNNMRLSNFVTKMEESTFVYHNCVKFNLSLKKQLHKKHNHIRNSTSKLLNYIFYNDKDRT